MEQDLARLLRFVAGNEGASVARAAKQLAMPQSELLRLLVVLGEDASVGGLGLVQREPAARIERLRLSARGRAWLERHA